MRVAGDRAQLLARRRAAAGAAGSRPRSGRPAPERGAGRAWRPRAATPFAAALARVAATLSRSLSTASTGPKPSFAAAIASTPEPQPRSTSAPPGSSSSSSSRHSRVVACAPVPNACAGIDDEVDLARALGARRLPRRPHAQAAAQLERAVEVAPALVPVVGQLLRADLHERVAGRGAEVGEVGQLARGRRRRRTRQLAGGRAPPPRPRAPDRRARRARARPLARHADRKADHAVNACRRTRRSLPSIGLVAAQVLLAERLRELAEQLALARSRRRGITTLTTTRRSPGARCRASRACPCRAARSSRRAACPPRPSPVPARRAWALEVGAERGERGRDVQRGDEVVAVADEACRRRARGRARRGRRAGRPRRPRGRARRAGCAGRRRSRAARRC